MFKFLIVKVHNHSLNVIAKKKPLQVKDAFCFHLYGLLASFSKKKLLSGCNSILLGHICRRLCRRASNGSLHISIMTGIP